MEHLEQSKELCFQLPILFGLNVFAIQLYFIIGKIAFKLNVLIMRLFLKFLGMIEVFLVKNHQFS